MTFDDYQRQALKTAIYPDQYRILYPALALAEEAGEVCGKIAKVLRDKDGQFNADDRQQIRKELGDVLWDMAALAGAFGITLNDIASYNLDKLAARAQRGTLGGSGDSR